MSQRSVLLACVGLLAASSVLRAQTAIPLGKDAQVGSGVVTGHVFFADTNGPARFVKVLLKPAVASNSGDDFAKMMEDTGGAGDGRSAPAKPKLSAADQAEMAKQKAASAKFMSALTDMMISATVAADGSYLFTNVRPGSYYVHAIAPGYIDPLSAFSAEDLASTDPAMKQKIAAALTAITVSGTDAVKADLRLERGASIAGRVLYDDGTPAVGWTVRTVHGVPGEPVSMGLVDLGDLDLAHISESGTTDDTGHFRIAGLPSGSYVLKAQFQGPVLGQSSFNPKVVNSGSPFSGGGMAGMMGLKLTVFSGNAMRQADAQPLSVKAGEERSGYDLTVPLHLMHSLGGTVRAKADGHLVNGGTVDITALDTNGKDDASVHLTASIHADGTFRFDYLAGPATYSVRVSHAVDATTVSTREMMGSLIAEQKTTHSYGSATTTTMLGDTDVTDLKLDVPEADTK